MGIGMQNRISDDTPWAFNDNRWTPTNPIFLSNGMLQSKHRKKESKQPTAARAQTRLGFSSRSWERAFSQLVTNT
jgi:hypothetical protein